MFIYITHDKLCPKYHQQNVPVYQNKMDGLLLIH